MRKKGGECLCNNPKNKTLYMYYSLLTVPMLTLFKLNVYAVFIQSFFKVREVLAPSSPSGTKFSKPVFPVFKVFKRTYKLTSV